MIAAIDTVELAAVIGWKEIFDVSVERVGRKVAADDSR
jgi:hypothetical protein